MFIHRELRFAVMSVSLAALAGCESLDNVMGALSSEQAAKVQEECGLIPPKSRGTRAATRVSRVQAQGAGRAGRS